MLKNIKYRIKILARDDCFNIITNKNITFTFLNLKIMVSKKKSFQNWKDVGNSDINISGLPLSSQISS